MDHLCPAIPVSSPAKSEDFSGTRSGKGQAGSLQQLKGRGEIGARFPCQAAARGRKAGLSEKGENFFFKGNLIGQKSRDQVCRGGMVVVLSSSNSLAELFLEQLPSQYSCGDCTPFPSLINL